jgi:uncharacterized membrane protein HdeD (DUF308 family)
VTEPGDGACADTKNDSPEDFEMLGASLVASGIMRIILAFSMKRETPWIWVAVSGIVTLLLGLLILAHWPINSVYILGLFLGIDLVIAGAGSGLALAYAAVRHRRRCDLRPDRAASMVAVA